MSDNVTDNDTGLPETGTCAICGGPFTRWGNNAEPVKSGRCCHDCNDMFVIPARLRLLGIRPIDA